MSPDQNTLAPSGQQQPSWCHALFPKGVSKIVRYIIIYLKKTYFRVERLQQRKGNLVAVTIQQKFDLIAHVLP